LGPGGYEGTGRPTSRNRRHAPDAELRALLAKISTTAEGNLGISPAETALAKQIQSHGAAAIPYLLPLLEHDEARVRRFAG